MTNSLVLWLHNAALVAALVVFLLHAWNVQPQVRPNLVGLGLALLTIAWLVVGIGPR